MKVSNLVFVENAIKFPKSYMTLFWVPCELGYGSLTVGKKEGFNWFNSDL